MRGFPNRYLVFDTESNINRVAGKNGFSDLTLRLAVGYFHDGSVPRAYQSWWSRYNTSKQFHDAVLDLPRTNDPIYVFAHNMGFDARMVEWFRYVSLGAYTLMPPPGVKGAGRYKSPLFVAESPPFIVRLWRKDGQQLMLIDTYQWLQKSLKELGDWIGTGKSQMPDASDSDDVWFDYCEQDVEVLKRCIHKLWRFLGSLTTPDFQPTPASQAAHLYRMRFEKKRIIRPEDITTLKLDRMAYFGGMVDCLYVGKLDHIVHQVDVTSLYPHVMSQNLYPCEVQALEHAPRKDPVPPDFDPRCHTAEVYLDSPNLPWPVKCAEGTWWVRGKVRTVLCGPELDVAISSGSVKYLGRWTRYRLTSLFDGFVKYMWAVRRTAQRQGDRFNDYLCKTIMNSLYGKFGQRNGEWMYMGKQCPEHWYSSGRAIGQGLPHDVDFRCLAGHVYERHCGEDDPKGFVPIAAWTSSYGRVFMDEIRALCGANQVYYQATDSLLLSGDGLGQLQLAGMVADQEIGSLKYEGSYECATINGVHNLDLGSIRRRPGVRRTASYLGGECYEQDSWEGFQAGVFAGRVSSVSISTICKHISMRYNRRDISSGGFTIPWEIDNWDIPPEAQKDLRLR